MIPLTRHFPRRPRILTIAAVLLAGVCAGATADEAVVPAAVLDYSFDEAQGAYSSAGTVQVPLTPRGENQRHGDPGSGVSGKPADRAWDASANTVQGVPRQDQSPNDSALSARLAQSLLGEPLKAFTLLFWFKADQSLADNNSTRFLVHADTAVPPIRRGMTLRSSNGGLELRVASQDTRGQYADAVVLSRRHPSETGFNRTHAWIFVAVVWDGQTVIYYVGDPQTPIAYAGGGPFTGPTLATNRPLFIGNTGGSDRGFDGLIDRLRFYDRALPSPMIEQLRRQDAAGPQ